MAKIIYGKNSVTILPGSRNEFYEHQLTHFGRFLLYLDILGFKNLVAEKSYEELYKTIDTFLSTQNELNKEKRFFSIYFSDSIIFCQINVEKVRVIFEDMINFVSKLFIMLLSKEIAVRGAISYGDFNVKPDSSKQHHVFFGEALIDAYLHESKEKWIGIILTPNCVEMIDTIRLEEYQNAMRLLKRKDGIMLLNPFQKILTVEESKELEFFLKSDTDRYILKEMAAIRFIKRESERMAHSREFSNEIAVKYHATDKYFRELLKNGPYEWFLREVDKLDAYFEGDDALSSENDKDR